jgi:hypothetical protein
VKSGSGYDSLVVLSMLKDEYEAAVAARDARAAGH